MESRFKNTIIFLVCTVLITWALYFPIPLLGLSPYSGPGFVLLFFGGSVPSWFGIIMVLKTYNTEQRRDYLQRCYQVKRITAVWWLVLLFLFPMIFAAAIGLDVAFGGSLPGMTNLRAIIANPLLFFPLIGLSFMSGPFSEELGWRGFALYPLLERFGFTKGSAILGFIWGVWHLPLFFMPETWHGRNGFQLIGFGMFLLLNIGLSFIMSWVFINSRGSILAAMLVHLSSNFSAQVIAGGDGMSSARLEVLKPLLVFAAGIAVALYIIRTKQDAYPRATSAAEQRVLNHAG